MELATPLFLILLALAQVNSPDATLEFDGLIEADQVIQLGARADGLLDSVNVDRGDIVRKDQIVAMLEADLERATLEIATARTEMKGMLQKHKARLQYSISKFVNDERLHKDGLLSIESLDQSKTEKLLAEAGYLEAHETMRLTGLEKRRAEVSLEQRIVRSPIDGVVVERFLSPGEMVTRLNQSRIVTIAQVDPLRVEVILPAPMFGKIDVGMRAEVRTAHAAGRRFSAKVKTVDRVIKAASNTFRVRLELPNSDNRLPPGLRCRVRFPKKAKNATAKTPRQSTEGE